jgi:nucleoside-diphosphate kinase
MGKQLTLVLIKPDAVRQWKMGEIISRFDRKNLEIYNLKMYKLPPVAMVKEHYKEHEGKDFFLRNVNFIAMGPVVALILSGEDSVEVVRNLVGNCDPAKAAAGTIRGDLGQALPYNCVHASDSVESANREIGIWFGEDF